MPRAVCSSDQGYKLDFMRHGETELSHTLRGSTDDALTEKGWQQMEKALLQAIQSGIQWDVIFSSPLQRCSVFALQAAQQLGLELQYLPQLQEMHFGDWEAQTTQHLYETVPEQLEKFWLQPTMFSPPNAETLVQFEQRVEQALQKINAYMQIKKCSRALVISHGGVIKLLKCKAMSKPLNDLLKMSAELGQLNHFYSSANDFIFIDTQEQCR
ncbi:histidine phosphatase family protein [Acinetobacter tianfuensis]|uniref:Histidine phosphatase family protein n=1 Tax=Acinetobacter tianfuensis TaxID=2419603 RepID=A0A3A8EFB2_9GAMM|nr:histidine phosphatase family protein [Acinetobacter tianfuensis]RKG29520.1 histidine phosphatase family protein [Acinetobacter tianfuensis]